jgi:protein-L-isoaspartate(D-aspartate) O-methyltransferase
LTARLNDHNDDAGLGAGRERMLALLRAHVRDERVMAAMAVVPRERFVPDDLRARAYDDNALPIGEGQTISQPLIVALMTEALALRADDRVLEIGTGSGYQAAVLSRLAGEVVSIERVAGLREHAQRLLAALGYANVGVYAAGDMLGLAERGPYDAIIVTAAAPHMPRVLLDQLESGGRLVIPVGGRRGQELVRAVATAHGVELTRLGACAFVPLVGRDGWPEESSSDAARSPKVR